MIYSKDQGKKTVLILRNLRKEESDFLKKLDKKTINLYYADNLKFKSYFRGFSTNIHQISPEAVQKIDDALFKKIVNFGDKFIENERIVNRLNIEKFNFWHLNKFRLYYQIRESYYVVEDILERSKSARELHVFSSVDYSKYQDFPENVHFHIDSDFSKKRDLKPYFTLFSYSLVFLYRAIIGFFQQSTLFGSSHYIYDLLDHHHVFLSQKSFQPKIGNLYYNYLLEQFPDFFVRLQEIQPPKLNGKKNYFQYVYDKEGIRFNCENILFQSLFSIKNWWQINKAAKKIRQELNEIKKADISKVEYRFIDFLLQHKKTLYYYLFRYIAFKRWFQKNQHIRTITAVGENASIPKIMLDAAKTQRIKTFGIQHGIAGVNPDYRFTEYDIKQYQPMPDKTLVWGSIWKSILVEKSNYLPSTIKVTGQLRTDIISLIQQNDKKLAKQSFRVIFYSQPLEENYKKRILEILFKGFKALENQKIELIIRLHPKEKNLTFFYEVAERLNNRSWKFSDNTDLYFQLETADLVITVHSTVGTEAIYFQKPLIIIDPYMKDLVGYLRNRVAISARNEKELKNVIISIITGRNIVSTKHLDQYIKEHAFKIDGKVAERIVSFIENFEAV